MTDMLIQPQVPTRTTCAYCGVGCGVLAMPYEDDSGQRRFEIKGDPDHPANKGRLCVKGSALGETVGLAGRQLYPLVEGQRVSWDEATRTIADQFSAIRDEHGPEAIAFYVSGQLLTEDYYVVNKLAKGFIGTPNVDTNSRLCMSSAVAGHKRAFGTDTVPVCYDDLDEADLIVLVGSNAAWCHPIVYQRIKATKAARAESDQPLRIVSVDPRITATNEIVDLHLPIRSGTDVLLFNYLLTQVARNQALDSPYVAQHTEGLEAALAFAEQDVAGESVTQVAARLGVSASVLATLVEWVIETPKMLTLFSMGVNQSGHGTDKVNAIINLHLATGRIGRAGMGPFSLTGQPNAMGGREVGGLANMLAAHLEIHEPAHRALVQEFWQSPTIIDRQGLKAVDLFEAVESGRIKAIWIMATNPLVSLPDADRVKQALERCPLVVVSEVMAETECTKLATVVLPALAWGEKDGTVTNSERRISRQRAVVAGAGESRADWWALSQVAQKMRYSGFEYQSPHAIFEEHARLSGIDQATIRRDFDISGLASLDAAAYDALAPIQWPVTASAPAGQARFFADGQFFTPNRRARLIAVHQQPVGHRTTAEYPFVLNTGRIRDQWHTMTRTGLTGRLTRHISEPYLELHADDALRLGLEEGDIATVHSAWGQATARAVLSEGQQQGMVFMPIHWNGINSRSSRVGAVVNPVVDPYSGQPEAKHTPVQVAKAALPHHGFVLTRGDEPLPLLGQATTDYAVNVRTLSGFRQEFAVQAIDDDALAWLDQRMAAVSEQLATAERIEFMDGAQQHVRLAWLVDGVLEAVAMVGPRAVLPPRSWLDEQVGKPIDAPTRRVLLSGVPADPASDVGPIVCSCFGVGQNTILRAIEAQKLCSVQAVGQCLKAGTNCGSCQSEIARLLNQPRTAESPAFVAA